MEYLEHVPDAIPSGKVLVHNRVAAPSGKPGHRLGSRGFRAWLDTPKDDYQR